MTSVELRCGLPDIGLSSASGATINPADFAGHELIALFCPLEPAAAAREIAAWRQRSSQLVECDAWLLTFADHSNELARDGLDPASTIPDMQRHAWGAFRDLTGHAEEFDRSRGAAFLFTRGGGLQGYWHGAGCVDQVLAELRKPSFEPG